MLVGLKSKKSDDFFFFLQQASFVSSVNFYTEQVPFASNLSSSGARMHKLTQKHAQTHTHIYTHTNSFHPSLPLSVCAAFLLYILL